MTAPGVVLAGGRIFDPASGRDGAVGDIIIRDRMIAGSRSDGDDVIDCAGLIVCPGLIDIHTHIYWGATSCGLNADLAADRGGATTVVDAGSAGPGTLAGFRAFAANCARARVL